MIRSEQDGRVRRITLAAPEQRNLLSRSIAEALLREIAEAEADDGTGAILIDAEGSIFCGGLDWAELPPDEIFSFGARSTKPVVAAMQGVAISAGLALLANAHIVVAAQGSSFGLTDIRDGLYHAGVTAAVAGILGERRTRELGLTGRIFTTPEAVSWGLVHAAVPAFELDDRVLAAAQGLAGAKADAVRAILGKRS
ncbi:MAG: enoyl-CoA hydratase/isomerase family protein [Acidobacteriota bacterium]